MLCLILIIFSIQWLYIFILKGLPVCNGSSACLLYPNLPSQTLVIGNYTKNPFVSGGNIIFINKI